MDRSPYGITKCRAAACRAAVFFAPTRRGATAIVDAVPVPDGNVYLDRDGFAVTLKKGEHPPAGAARYLSHWTTCADKPRFANERLGNSRR